MTFKMANQRNRFGRNFPREKIDYDRMNNKLVKTLRWTFRTVHIHSIYIYTQTHKTWDNFDVSCSNYTVPFPVLMETLSNPNSTVFFFENSFWWLSLNKKYQSYTLTLIN